MPTVDLTVTITTILALVAIISPVLTAIIDNVFRLILKHLENKQKRYEQNTLHKRELFENFLSAFNEVCHLRSDDAVRRYASSYSLIYIYLPLNVCDDLGKVNLLISEKCWDDAIKHVDPISLSIYKEMQKLKL